MATVKIRDLPYITSLQSNTANTVLVGVDVPGDYTGQLTLTTLARGLYSNNFLYVGNNDILLANAVGQFTGNADPYLQLSLHNNNGKGSGDFVVTGDTGTDTTHYVDVGIQGSQLTQGALLPLDSYLISVGDTSTTPGGNLIIGTDTVNRNISITLGGHETDNIAAEFIYGEGFKLTQKPLIFADGTSQNSAVAYTGVDSRISSNVSTINDSITANAVSANSVINTRITANIATANLFTQSAFDKANNALANTNGVTTAGALTISGMANVGAQVFIANSTYDYTNTALVRIVGSSGAFLQPPANPGYMLQVVGIDGISSRVVNSSYGSNAYALFAGRKGNGTAGTPTAVANNDVIARFSGSGYNGTGFTSTGQARIDIVADENYTVANNGSRIEFYNTIPQTNTVTKIATFNANTVTFTGSVYPNKGFIYSPRVLNGAQTAITIDFSSDSIIRATFNSTLTISLSNYVFGKIVDVWVTNTAGNGQTINLGALSNNVTTGSATLSVAAGRSAKLQYFSIDGDQANTFLAVTYA